MLLSLQMRRFISKKLNCGLNSFSILHTNYSGIGRITFKCLIDNQNHVVEVSVSLK